ncbi:MAG: hypothetical protein IEMM0002_1038 [bacterium]|nr:MAG: hypothetical protein IEMM0002_1038 [bacterium]
MRICELAKGISVKSADIIAELKKLKVTGKTASSTISEELIPVVKQKLAGKKSASASNASKTSVKKIAAKTAEKKKPVKTASAKARETAERKEAEMKKEAEKAAEEARKKEKEKRRKASEEISRKAEEARRQEEKLKKEKEEEAELRRIEKEIEDEAKRKKEDEAKQIVIDEAITLKELAEILKTSPAEIIRKLFLKGVAVTVNQTLGVELASEIAKETGYTVKVKHDKVEESSEETKRQSEDLSHLPLRPPVVTVMGHVDHGKTTLLDSIRKTDVAGKEAGGITQHIGAYSIDTGHGLVTLIDTPGHEAFTTLRARGAQVTDVVVLVVAADDGIMPQTEEAVNHAKDAGVTILVAVNKIDKPDAQPDKVKQEFTRFGLVPEEWGGTTIFCNVSAKTGEGIDHLVEMIHLQAELLELHADPKESASATVIESKLDKSRGPVHTIIINKGTMRQGDSFVAGVVFGKVRAMMDDKGKLMKTAGPGLPVELLGANAICSPGEELVVVKGDKKARQISQERQSDLRRKNLLKKQHVRLENVVEGLGDGELKELKLVIKGDTQGSLDGLAELLSRFSFEKIKLQVIHSGVGGVTETDIVLADASDAIVIGFNVRPTEKARKLAAQEKIDVRLYNVIYEITDDIKSAMQGMLDPEIVEKRLGRAEVREAFKITGIGVIAGCRVLEGLIRRNTECRLVRDNVVVHTGIVSSLRRFKEDVKEVSGGYECGIGIEKYNDIKVGDVIEIFEFEEATREAVLS